MIDLAVVGAWAFMGLAGEYDLANADEIRVVAAQLRKQGVSDLTVDLSRVTFFGAAGLNALVALNQVMTRDDGRIVLVGATALTRRLLTITGLDHTLALAVVPPLPGMSPGDEDAPAAPDSGAAGSDDTERALSRQLFDIYSLLLTEPTVTDDLQRVAETAVAVVPGATAATIALLAQGVARTTAVTDSVAIEVDVAQYILDEGPCLDAMRTSERLRVDLLGGDERFLHFAPLALRAGIHAVLSLPLVVGGSTVGTLNLYSSVAFEPSALVSAEIIAGQAAIAVAKSEVYAAARRLALHTGEQVQARRNIHIAEGVIAGLQQCTIEQAQRLMRSAAAANGETLIEVAGRIIGYLRESPDRDRPPRFGR